MDRDERKIVGDSVRLSELNKMVKRINKDLRGADADISFEFFVATLFPNVYNNIREALTQQYIAGANSVRDK